MAKENKYISSRRSTVLSWGKRLVFLAILFITYLVVLGNFSFSRVQAAVGNVSETRIVELINVERTKNGLPSYNLNQLLVSSAASKGADMIRNNYWSHISPAGKAPWSFISNAGYRYTTAGENLANGYSSSEEVVSGWLNSPSHKANITNNKFKDIGISILRGNLQGKDTILVVAHFGAKTNKISQRLI